MKHLSKLVHPTKYKLVTMPPKFMNINHLMKEHFPKDGRTIFFECFVNVTTFIIIVLKNHDRGLRKSPPMPT